MSVSVHNPDQYMASLRQIIAQGRKRIGLLVGAGGPAGTFPPGSDKPLIPAVAGLTDMVTHALRNDYGKTLDAIVAELETPNIETIPSRVPSLGGVIGKTKVQGLDGEAYKKLGDATSEQIGTITMETFPSGIWRPNGLQLSVQGVYSRLLRRIPRLLNGRLDRRNHCASLDNAFRLRRN